MAQNAWKGGHRAERRELRLALAAQRDALDDWQFLGMGSDIAEGMQR